MIFRQGYVTDKYITQIAFLFVEKHLFCSNKLKYKKYEMGRSVCTHREAETNNLLHSNTLKKL